MASQTYDKSEFVSLRFYLGTYEVPEGRARYNYYNMSGTPTLVFNGTHQIVGASVADAQGEQYMDVILSRYFDLAPVKIDVDFTPGTGATSATVEMYSTTDALTDDWFHLVLIEDDIGGDNTHVMRDMISSQFSLTGSGNTATFNETFTLDIGWNPDNLYVIAFVQRQNQEVVQTASTYPYPDFSVRAMVPFDQNIIGPSDGTYQSDAVTIMNVGLTETFTIDLVIDEAPPGWTASFTDSGGTGHTTPYDFGLTTDEMTTFHANVTPAGPGYMRYHFVISSTNLAKDLEIPFIFSTDDVDALFVDDDGGYAYESYFQQALEDAGLAYGFWNLSLSKLSPAVADISTLIWSIGLGYPSLDETDRAFLESYLDAGNALFITGQDVGWDLASGQSDNTDQDFYHNYLHANYLSDDVNLYDVEGVNGDPVSDGQVFVIQGGDGADNQEYPSRISAYDADATEIYRYSAQGWGAGIRSTDSVSGARVVYQAFGFEAINDAQDRADVMRGVIYWLNGILLIDGFESGDTSAWSSVSP